MLGAIAGDVIGSPYEAAPIKSVDFPLFSEASRFTDDSVLTVAVAHAILGDGDYAAALRAFGRRHPHAGYGGSFFRWLQVDDAGPYGSWGNGSAMRVSPVGWAFDAADEVLREAARSAAVTHDHPEGIKGAQAVALAVLRARQGAGRDEIRAELVSRFGYELGRSVDEIRPGYGFDVSCQGSVPQALRCWLEAADFEQAVRLAVSLGGDADTLACMAGAVAEASFGVPAGIGRQVRERLTPDLLEVLDRFTLRFQGIA